MSVRCIAVIPARGGSTGIPRKNLQVVGGEPLLVRTIRASLTSSRVDRTYVSTDDDEITRVAVAAGAEVIKRPADISDDRASSEAALLHALEHLEATEGVTSDLLVFLQCTSPFTTAEDIDGAIQTLERDNADSVFTAASFHGFLWHRSSDGLAHAKGHDPQKRRPRQELAEQFVETGAVYVMRVSHFRHEETRFCGRVTLHEIDPARAIEVDEPTDLIVAQTLAQYAAQKSAAALLPNPIGALVLDFDGVMTDDLVTTSEDGLEAVTSSRRDGMGMAMLRRLGIPILVLSTETNKVVTARCDKLGIESIQGVEDKLSALRQWSEERGIGLDQVVYAGNDVNDLPCLEAVGCGVVVADSHPDVIPAANLILDRPGGRGAVRELADLIVKQQGDKGP